MVLANSRSFGIILEVVLFASAVPFADGVGGFEVWKPLLKAHLGYTTPVKEEWPGFS
jgi:hypothetical protein